MYCYCSQGEFVYVQMFSKQSYQKPSHSIIFNTMYRIKAPPKRQIYQAFSLDWVVKYNTKSTQSVTPLDCNKLTTYPLFLSP